MPSESRVAVIDEQPTTAVMVQQLETEFEVATRQRELLENYIRDRLRPAKHFYQMGGSGKNSLTKDGAELICLPHGLKPKYEVVSGPTEALDGDDAYQITVRCGLYKGGGEFGGEGLGSASSMLTRRDQSRVPRQLDPGLRHNSTLKMAAKSAYVAATLSATAASEFFTQDLEDAVTVPSGRASQAGPDQAAPGYLYCTEHDTSFFKRGKMRTFAHPVGEGVPWHNMPDAPEPAQEPRTTAEHPQQQPMVTMAEEDPPPPEEGEVDDLLFSQPDTGAEQDNFWNWLETELLAGMDASGVRTWAHDVLGQGLVMWLREPGHTIGQAVKLCREHAEAVRGGGEGVGSR